MRQLERCYAAENRISVFSEGGNGVRRHWATLVDRNATQRNATQRNTCFYYSHQTRSACTEQDRVGLVLRGEAEEATGENIVCIIGRARYETLSFIPKRSLLIDLQPFRRSEE